MEIKEMHSRLKFSWAHIIALTGLIAWGFFTFAGVAYLTGGKLYAGYACGGILIVILGLLFLIPQQLKCNYTGLKRSLLMEKILVLAAPAVFLLTMLPAVHFLTVVSSGGEINSRFLQGSEYAKNMFADYYDYSSKRLEAYGQATGEVIEDMPSAATTFGFASFPSLEIQRRNMMETLRLKLLPPTLQDLQKESVKWLEDAYTDVSPWDVFVIGNTDEIISSEMQWGQYLDELSQFRMSNSRPLGRLGYHPEDYGKELFYKAQTEFVAAKEIFTKLNAPSVIAILITILVLAMLSLPYLVQPRNLKDRFHGLLPWGKAGMRYPTGEEEVDHFSQFGGLRGSEKPGKPENSKSSKPDGSPDSKKNDNPFQPF